MQISVQGSPLSIQQARLWPLQKDSRAYQTIYAIQIQGILDNKAFKTTLGRVIKQNETLRTAFYSLPGMDIPMQVVNERDLWSYADIYLEHLHPSDQVTKVDELFTSFQHYVYDLRYGPTFYTCLLHLGLEKHILVVSQPALCADMYSIKLFVDELLQAYANFFSQHTPAEEILQYADVSAWQEELLQEDKIHYWNKLKLAPTPTIGLPFEQAVDNFALDSSDPFTPDLLAIPIRNDLAAKIAAAARRYDVSISSWLLTCWQTTLWRLHAKPAFLIGVSCNGRDYEELHHALGLYARFIPVYAPFEKDRPFASVLTSVHKLLQEALAWQMYFTWDKMHDTVGNDRTNPFFPVSFEYDVWPETIANGTLTCSLFKRWSCTEPFSLKLSVLQVGKDLQLELHYDPQHISAAHIHTLKDIFHTLLINVVEQPQTYVGAAALFPAETQKRLLTLFRAPERSLPAHNLHHLFEAQVKQTPQQLAVISSHQQLTYQQLNEQANQLAHVLRRHGVGPNVIVGLCMQREAQALVAILAILKAGGAYLPLDPTHPPTRLTYQLQTSQALLLLTQQELQPHLPLWGGNTFNIEELAAQIAQSPRENRTDEYDAQDLAYIIFTSGSTGNPKGVMVQHKGAVNYTLALCKLLDAQPSWQYATGATLAADLGNTAIFCALLSGGCVQILDYELVTSVQAMTRWVQQHPIDVLKIVPSHLSALLVDESSRAVLPKRALVLGGETLPVQLLTRIRELGGTCAVYNHYGPTETTIGVMVNPLGVLTDKLPSSVPLGRPICNMQLYILDQRMQLVPAGVTGELYVAGAGVARGYIGQSALTAERFVPHPYSDMPGQRLYRTGDLVCATPQGDIQFLGRSDQQVKLRGYRIELGEIEAILRLHPNIRDCVVILRQDRAFAPRLVAYLVSKNLPVSGTKELQDFVNAHAPKYMVPAAFVHLNALPLTTNGKIDRAQLPEPEQSWHNEKLFGVAPRNPVEEILLEIWRNLLPGSEFGIYDNFFQIGGNSLVATQLIARIQSILNIELSILSPFEAPTIAELAQRVEVALQHDQKDTRLPLVAVARTNNDIPLSFAQQRLWFLEQLAPGGSVYLVPKVQRFLETLNVEALELSLRAVVQRHESLRTTFSTRDGQAIQMIHPEEDVTLPLIDLQGLTDDQRTNEAQKLAWQDTQCPCDLQQGPLFRTYLVRLETQKHELLLTLHHIITDAWSNEVLIRDLTISYQAFVAGQPSPLMPLPIQYADYAIWQRQSIQGEVLERQLAYWKKQLAGGQPLELPLNYPRPPIQTHRGAFHAQQLSAGLYDELMALSQQESVTLFMLLMGAFQVLLLRYTGQTDISVGTPIANRGLAEIEDVIGNFVNTLVFRTDLSGNPSFIEVLKRVRMVALEAYTQQDVPFEQIVEALQPIRDMSRSPLFEVTFSLHRAADTIQEPEELILNRLEANHHTAKFDISFNVLTVGHKLYCGVIYSTELFEAQTIDRMLAHWQTLLEGIVAAPHSHLSDLPLLTQAERYQLLTAWNETQADYPQGQCMHQIFERRVEHLPDVVALTFLDTHLTYAALDRRANQLAHKLQELGVQPDTLVGLCVERSLEMIVGMLGILKAGGAYLPLDPAYPSERLAFILADSAIRVLVTQDQVYNRLPPHQATRVFLDTDWPAIARYSTASPRCEMQVENLAYVIYTSGSTGTPKGVQVTHCGIGNLASVQEQAFNIQVGSRELQFASFNFDASFSEIVMALLVGATLCLAPQEQLLPGPDLLQLLHEQAITQIKLPPSVLTALPPTTLSNLQTIIVGGEACSTELVRRWAPSHHFFNAYGPTETTVCVCAAQCFIDTQTLTVGRPFSNIQFYVLDRSLQPVPVGITGELCIGGIGLARGYLRRPELTATRFIPHPFSTVPGQRLYRTGDLVRYRPDGTIEFQGRDDHQIKLRGYRIELGEIEEVVKQHPAIQSCVAQVRNTIAGEKCLTLYSVLRSGQTLTNSHLRSYLQDHLPPYMIPAAFVSLDTLPLTPNGKLDRAALPAPDLNRTDESESLPHTLIEELLVQIWSDVLGIKKVGIHDNFFEIGGHSLLATQVISRIRTSLQIEIPLSSLFESPAIAALAARIEHFLQKEYALQSPPIVPVPHENLLPLSLMQQRIWFLDQVQSNDTTYLMTMAQHCRGILNSKALEWSIQEIIHRHEILRTTFTARAGQPMQVIHPATTSCLPCIDLSGLEHKKQHSITQQLIQQESQHPCNLEKGPLFRVHLLRLASHDHILLLTLHHILTDGWSNKVLVRELTALYQASLAEQPSPLPPPLIQYADYAFWQHQWLQGDILQKYVRYWQQQLEGARHLELPTDKPRPATPSTRGARYSFVLPKDLSLELDSLSRHEGVTLFMTLLTAFQVFLYRLTDQADIVVGTDVANRTRLETEGLIGFFVNLLALRTNVQGAPKFRQVLQSVRKMVLEAYAYQELPFDLVVEQLLGVERRSQQTPLISVLFVLQNIPEGVLHLPGLQLTMMSQEQQSAKFDLALFLQEEPDGIRGSVVYRTELFEELTIATWMRRFEILLQDILTNPDTVIDLLAIYTEEEKRVQLQEKSEKLNLKVKHLRNIKGKNL